LGDVSVEQGPYKLREARMAPPQNLRRSTAHPWISGFQPPDCERLWLKLPSVGLSYVLLHQCVQQIDPSLPRVPGRQTSLNLRVSRGHITGHTFWGLEGPSQRLVGLTHLPCHGLLPLPHPQQTTLPTSCFQVSSCDYPAIFAT
jgi:hypothetical protein